MSDWPGKGMFEVGYDEITANVAITSLSQASPTTVISCAAHTFSGAPVVATFHSYTINTSNSSSVDVYVGLFEGSTFIDFVAEAGVPGVTNQAYYKPCDGWTRLTPTPGNHTYKIAAWLSGGSANNPQVCAAATAHAFVRFVEVRS